jgi:hypothetical protein
MGSEYIDPHILDFGTNWNGMISFTPRPLYPQWNSPQYLLSRRLCGPQNLSGRNGEDIFTPTGTRTPTFSQSLYRLRYPVSISQESILRSLQSASGAWDWEPYRHLWTDCLDRLGSSTSHNLIGPQGLLQGWIYFSLPCKIARSIVKVEVTLRLTSITD